MASIFWDFDLSFLIASEFLDVKAVGPLAFSAFVDLSFFEFWLLLLWLSLHEHTAVIVRETLQFASWQWRVSCKLPTTELLGCLNTTDCSNCTIQGSFLFCHNLILNAIYLLNTIQSDTSASESREENCHELSPKENFSSASSLYHCREWGKGKEQATFEGWGWTTITKEPELKMPFWI